MVVIVLHSISITIKNNAPNNNEVGNCLRLSLPTKSLDKCGITSPIQPIVPVTQTVDAVRQLAHAIKTALSLVTFIPSVFASTSPNEMIFKRQASARITIIQTMTSGAMTAKSPKFTRDKDPICQ